jgi:dTDP-4-amino-4,6-dideoxygalactose transaminase
VIHQADPARAYLRRKDEFDAAVERSLTSGRYILDGEVMAFEDEFAKYVGVRQAVGVANGTDALELALRAVGVGSGDVVLTVSHTAIATIAAIARCGAVAAVLDIDAASYLLDASLLSEAVRLPRRTWGGRRLAAVVAVHLYGRMVDMPSIMMIARDAGLKVVEDCAQAHGARLGSRHAGSWGDAGAFSFYPTKNLAAFGDGGLVTTNDPEIAESVRRLRQYGWTNDRISVAEGFNSRLDEVQAAILRVGLQYLDADNQRRRDIAATYDSMYLPDVVLPQATAADANVYHQYVIRVRNRDAVMAHMRALHVGTAIHYPVSAHRQPGFSKAILAPLRLSETERAESEILSLPIYPMLEPTEVDRVREALAQAVTLARPR